MASTQTGRARGSVSGSGGRPGRLPDWAKRPWAVRLISAGAWAGALALIFDLTVRALTIRSHRHLLADLHVYRNGGLAILHGTPLYSMVTNGKLLYTYPPASAVLGVPLAWVPWRAAQILWMAMIYVPLGIVIWLAFRPLLTRARRYAPAVFAVLLAGAAMLTPMRQEVHYGQIDIFLVALCTVDCMARRTWWPRGALIGMATAIKLVPGVFVIYLLITGRRKAAGVAALSFAAWTGLAWLIAPADSTRYWSGAVFSSHRLGPNAQSDNQSLRGLLLRGFFPTPPPTALWIALVLVVAVAGFVAASRVWQRGFEVGGVAITGLLAALLSPVAWIHHYCWIIVAVAAIAGDCRREWRVIIAITIGGLFTSVLPTYGGYLYFSRAIPALPAMAAADSFSLAGLALIWIIWKIPVTATDRRPLPPARGPAGPDPALQRQAAGPAAG
ncbi:MAG TPA: glycosyltransferase 87 family protein [Streptosporangiaceae bacterium]|nr:glycosyltransferase 87 family protein [Streptosporangiaceae bacterium]